MAGRDKVLLVWGRGRPPGKDHFIISYLLRHCASFQGSVKGHLSPVLRDPHSLGDETR